jgi:hypothetical protein
MRSERSIEIQHSPHRDQLAVTPKVRLELVLPEIIDSDQAVVLLDTIHLSDQQPATPVPHVL